MSSVDNDTAGNFEESSKNANGCPDERNPGILFTNGCSDQEDVLEKEGSFHNLGNENANSMNSDISNISKNAPQTPIGSPQSDIDSPMMQESKHISGNDSHDQIDLSSNECSQDQLQSVTSDTNKSPHGISHDLNSVEDQEANISPSPLPCDINEEIVDLDKKKVSEEVFGASDSEDDQISLPRDCDDLLPNQRNSPNRSRSPSVTRSENYSPARSHSKSRSRSNSRSSFVSRSISRNSQKSKSRSRSGSPRSRSGSRQSLGAKSKSRSRSRSLSHPRSRSRSGSRSVARSRSRSGSRTVVRSRSRSGSRNASRSRSRSGSRSVARSRSRSGSRSVARSRSRSGSRNASRSRSRSGSRSVARSRSRSGSRSVARSRSRSGSRSVARSRSRSGSRSVARSRSRSVSGSRKDSRSRSRSRSGSRKVSRSRSRSASKSLSRSRSRSRSGSRSVSRSRSRSGSRSRSRSGSRSSAPRSRSVSRSSMSRSRSRSGSSRSRSRSGSRGRSPVKRKALVSSDSESEAPASKRNRRGSGSSGSESGSVRKSRKRIRSGSGSLSRGSGSRSRSGSPAQEGAKADGGEGGEEPKALDSDAEDEQIRENLRRGEEQQEFLNDFDLMMARKKEEGSRRRRKNNVDIINDNEEHISIIVRRMREAADDDRRLNIERKPATKKIAMLEAAFSQLKKVDLIEGFLDANILTALTDWLAPMPDKSLSSTRIREAALKWLCGLPALNADMLKTSGIGKAVMYLYKHPKELKANKEMCGRLISMWARPIFNNSSDFKTLSKEERMERDLELSRSSGIKRKDEQQPEDDSTNVLRPGDKGWCYRARVPMPSTKDYVNRPRWQREGEISKNTKKQMSRLDKQLRAFKEKQRQAKARRAVPISIEGRNMSL